MFLQHTILSIVVVPLFIPHVLGRYSTVLGVNTTISKINASDANSSKIFNEGGAQEDPSLYKENDLLSLSKENGKIKKTSSVVRKDGVKYSQDLQFVMKTDSSIAKQLNITESEEINKFVPSTQNITSDNKTFIETKEGNKTVVHKPLILSYDILSKINVNQNKLSSLPNIQSSSKTVPDQVPSPNEDANNVKPYSMNPVKHPDMIMPIVITILVVPMFAVLGYMAVKRGKEAWKNRHYKRMDFLLDGMYND